MRLRASQVNSRFDGAWRLPARQIVVRFGMPGLPTLRKFRDPASTFFAALERPKPVRARTVFHP
jgi:hypothetical protein